MSARFPDVESCFRCLLRISNPWLRTSREIYPDRGLRSSPSAECQAMDIIAHKGLASHRGSCASARRGRFSCQYNPSLPLRSLRLLYWFFDLDLCHIRSSKYLQTIDYISQWQLRKVRGHYLPQLWWSHSFRVPLHWTGSYSSQTGDHLPDRYSWLPRRCNLLRFCSLLSERAHRCL